MTTSRPAPRHDAYRNIHKGLRVAMFDTVHRIGRLDVADTGELQAALDQAESLLRLMAQHLKHENEHMHTALEARAPGAARRTADDHVEHLESLDALGAQVAALRTAAPAAAPALAHRLYLDLAQFAAENLEHMGVEETQNNEQLWSLYSDPELLAIHERLLAGIEPAFMMEAIGWMARGLSVPELAGLLGELRHKAPPPAFQAVLGLVRSRIEPARWSRLAEALALPSGTAAAAV